MVLQERTQTILTAVLGVIALGLMLFLLYIQVTAYQETRQAIGEEIAAIKEVEVRLAELKRLAQQAEELEGRKASLDRLIPLQPEEDQLIEEIKEMAVTSGVRFLEVRFEEPVDKEGYIEMPLEMAFEGRYHDLLLLLAALEEGPRALRLDEIKVSHAGGCAAEIKADLDATVFYRVQKSGKERIARRDKDETQAM
ncbi:MAG TPA: hypothetical protein EYP63_04025 [Desulfotomaculum sp.]|nr:hypothetical protein [Desulfotomaculum sp.]